MISKTKICLSNNAWQVFILLAGIWISINAISDMQNFSLESMKWKVVSYFLTAVILLLIAFLYTLMFTRIGAWLISAAAKLPFLVKLTCVIIFNTIVIFYLIFTEWGIILSGKYLRLIILLTLSLITSILFIKPKNGVIRFEVLFISIGITATLFSVVTQFASISNNPFSQSWSEGNRFYDYSLIFAKNLYNYNGVLKVPYNTPGRYALWGVLFLIPGLPIWVHRLWDAILWGFTPLLLAGLLTIKIARPSLRILFLFWSTLFIKQAPVYPHLLIPMILLAIIIWSDKFWIKVIAGAVISYYAGISRFTWAVLPGIWLVIQDLILYYPDRKGTWFRKLLPPTILGLAGILPGVLGTWGGVINPDQAFATTQPLLLNRLLPNPTYGEGILLGIAWMSLPLLIFIAWMLISRTWQISKLAQAAIWVSLSGFLILGLLASTKIGGGSNLHNLDMYFLTLVLIVTIAITQKQKDFSQLINSTPKLICILLIFIMIMPGWTLYRNQRLIPDVKQQRINNALQNIKTHIASRKDIGEILFLDQRQLLTFGYVSNIKLVPEYEKKYLMDQAMGNNASYFENFYNDLKNRRFSLIIADNQKIKFQEDDEAFSDENNAYIEWVSIPLLEEYKPVLTIKHLGLELLEPREE